MKKKWIALLIIVMNWSMAAQESGNKENVEVHFINNNNHTIQVHNERTNICDCTPYFGAELKECMCYVSKECFMENLSKLNTRAQQRLGSQFSKPDIEELKKMFEGGQWQELQKKFPHFMASIEKNIKIFDQIEESKKTNWVELGVLGVIGALYCIV